MSEPTSCDVYTLRDQIGMATVLATSGGRWLRRPTGITLPVAHGYVVKVDLMSDDTYRVQRVFRRGGIEFVKGEMLGVYCDQVGEVVYRAGCYHEPFGVLEEA